MMEAHNAGQDVLLVANQNVGKSSWRSCQTDEDGEQAYLLRTANLILKDMLRMKLPLSGSSTKTPKNLFASSLLFTMITCKTNLKSNADYLSEPALSLAQLLMLIIAHAGVNICHQKWDMPNKETPLPLFLL